MFEFILSFVRWWGSIYYNVMDADCSFCRIYRGFWQYKKNLSTRHFDYFISFTKMCCNVAPVQLKRPPTQLETVCMCYVNGAGRVSPLWIYVMEKLCIWLIFKKKEKRNKMTSQLENCKLLVFCFLLLRPLCLSLWCSPVFKWDGRLGSGQLQPMRVALRPLSRQHSRTRWKVHIFCFLS